MASDSRADDAAARSLRAVIGKLVSRLSRAVFGVCAVAVGLITLFVGAGTTGDSATVFLIVGFASILVGFVTISRLPRPTESDEPTERRTTSASTADAAADHTESDENPADRHRQRAD